MTRHLPADLAALLAAGLIVESEANVYRRPTLGHRTPMPSRSNLQGDSVTTRPLGRRPGRRPYVAPPIDPDICPGCGKDPWAEGVTSCKPKDVRGFTPPVHTWDDLRDTPDPPGDDNPCSCGAMPGGYHHWECGLEICPLADLHPETTAQLLFCGCYE